MHGDHDLTLASGRAEAIEQRPARRLTPSSPMMMPNMTGISSFDRPALARSPGSHS
jgi:hypothetical protein